MKRPARASCAKDIPSRADAAAVGPSSCKLPQPGDSGLWRKTFIVGRASITRQMDVGLRVDRDIVSIAANLNILTLVVEGGLAVAEQIAVVAPPIGRMPDR